MSPAALLKRMVCSIVLKFPLIIFLGIYLPSFAQLRELYRDNDDLNPIRKISFYSATSGYVAFQKWVGYTTDSGRTFEKKHITIGNVDYNSEAVNLTFGFRINGVKAFDQNNILVFGDYGQVPSILHSTNGGATFKVIYHRKRDPFIFGTVVDMEFSDPDTGFAIAGDQVIKTTNKGLSWTAISTFPESEFSVIRAIDNNNVYVYGDYNGFKIMKSANGGGLWSQVSIPAGGGRQAFFLTSSVGWVEVDGSLFFTSVGGTTWKRMNDPSVQRLNSRLLHFVNDSVGYVLREGFTVAKTTDSGKIWEPLARESNFTIGAHYQLFFWNNEQFWAGGDNGYLELTTNGGGIPIPTAFFSVDTSRQSPLTHSVNLLSKSKSSHQHQWFKNGTLLSNAHSTSYSKNGDATDTIMLVVSNGTLFDTVVRHLAFPIIPYPSLTSFSPNSAPTGSTITINGTNLNYATNVSFGGTTASSFTSLSSTSITAVVGSGSTGNVTVTTPYGAVSLPGFIYLPPPIISSVSPTNAAAGDTVLITGTNFTGANSVTIGGVSANFVVLSPISIQLIVPSGPSGSIIVGSATGKATYPSFTSKIVISGYTPTSGTKGTVIKISGTSLSNVTGVELGGSGLQFNIASPNLIEATVGQSQSGSIVVVSPQGNFTLGSFAYMERPTIMSVTPATGPINSQVTILGTNFHPIASNNVVYFGGVRARVIGGNSSSLTVTVPPGASSNAISVTSNYLTAFSSKTFIITFPDGGVITSGSLEKPVPLGTGTDRTPGIFSMADIDGDGKNDMVFINYHSSGGGHYLAIMRNTSENDQLVFDAPIEIEMPRAWGINITDLDGDGKFDLSYVPEESAEVSVLRNISSPGHIAFEQIKHFSIPSAMPDFTSADLDLDGKVDLVFSGKPLGFLKNVSDLGNIQFNAMTFESALRGQFWVADVNGDGKHDLAGRCDEGLCILKNNSTDILALSQPIATGGNPNAYSVGDIDGDGKMDVVSLDDMDPVCRVIKNTGVNGEISFDLAMTLQTEISPTDIALQDMDGDGRLDIVCSSVENNLISIFKNTSSGGAISFGPRFDYHEGTFYSENSFSTGDVNQDGKPDIIANPALQENHLVFLNKVSRAPYIESFAPGIGVTGTSVTIKGFNFSGVTSVAFGGTPAQSYSIISDTLIIAVVGNGSSGDVTIGSNFTTASKKGFQYGIVPMITSFSPVSGPAGTTVTISGSGFGSSAADNIVYFGGGKAKVVSASQTSLTVIAPTSSTVAPITVTTNKMTAYSSHHFTLKFESEITEFSDSSLKHVYSTYNVNNGILADVDGDGRLDLVYINSDHNNNNYYFAVKRNTSTRGSFSFDEEVGFYQFTGNRKLFSSDIDGDGLHDIIILNIDVNTYSIFKNTSLIGNISFAEKVEVKSGLDMFKPTDLTVMDVDLDGRPDIVVTNNERERVTVYKNVSTTNSISFTSATEYFFYEASSVILRDLNSDQKPEMIITGETVVTVFKNSSAPGSISFDAPQSFGGAGTHLQAADFDLDGKTDLALGNSRRYIISTMRNSSANNAISFDDEENYEADLWPAYISVGDLNGDGKPEIVSHNGGTISLFQNNSIPGQMIFRNEIRYTEPFVASSSGSIADVDGDGKTDLVLFGGWGVTIYKTETGLIDTVDVPLNSNVTLVTNLRGTSYQWQEDRGNGFVNLSDNINISGSQNDSLRLTNVPGSLSGYMYRCIVDGDTSRLFLLNVTCIPVHPVVNISTPSTSVCAGTPAVFTATPVNGGPSPGFQWTVNGGSVGTNSPTFTTSSLINGDIVKVSMRSDAVCQSDSITFSNSITMTVSGSSNPSVNISSSATSICPGTSVQFTATATNAGTSPTYQWKKNGINVGTNSSIYTDNTLRNSDVVSLALTSNASCVSNPVANSNTITMTVTSGNTPNVTIASSKNVICEGDAVTFTATPEFGGTAPSYKWLVNGIAASQANSFASSVLTNGARVSVVMTSNATCISHTNDTSNIIIMTVNTRVTPKVEISGPTLVNRGEFTVLNATVTNGGNNPAIQWQDSTNNTGWKDIPGGLSKTLIYAPPVNGTKVRCKLTSDDSCATVTSVLSQELVFTINLPTAIDPEPAETHGIRAFPNPVTDFLILDSLKLSDKWETAEVISLDGRQRLVFENIRNKTSVKIPVQKLSKGFYAAVLRRRNDAPVYIRFIKL